jgi:hypothetical protein
MIRHARQELGGSKAKFVMGDFLTIPAFPDTYDFVLASGTLNFMYETDLRPMITKMWQVTRGAMVFNLLAPPNVQLSALIATVRRFVGFLGVNDWQIRTGYLNETDSRAGEDVTVMFRKTIR